MSRQPWSRNEFLDQLRSQTDELADEAVRRLHREGGFEAVNRAFAGLTSDDQPLPADAPPAFVDFMEATAEMPTGIDFERLARGAREFEKNAFPAALVLLASSLPSGYSAPCLSRILTISDDLETHPYKRLMGVLQLIVNVSRAGSDELANLTARKLRLLHAGIRFIVPRYRPEYEAQFGPPVNHEDMLATIMGFSLLVVDGLARLEEPMADREAEDFYYQWAVFAQMMGIHPTSEPNDASLVPPDLASARTFYRAYQSRQFVAAAENPDGVRLSKINLQMIIDLIPRPMRWLGLGRLPRVVMEDLLGRDGMARVGLNPSSAGPIERGCFQLLVRLIHFLGAFAEKGGERLHRNFSLIVFQRMIDISRGGQVRFIVPENLAEVREDL